MIASRAGMEKQDESEHLVPTESKEVLEKQGMRACHGDTSANLSEFPLTEAGTI